VTKILEKGPGFAKLIIDEGIIVESMVLRDNFLTKERYITLSIKGNRKKIKFN